MTENFTKEEREALLRLLWRELDSQSVLTQAIYVTPAGRLRQQANEIEQREQDQPHLQSANKKLRINHD